MVAKIIIASGNAGKIVEIQQAFAGMGVTLLPQRELGIKTPPEPYATFVENAITKARHCAEQSGCAALSDDSGIVVPALNNAPGVHSARYSGAAATDESNNKKLIKAMQGVSDKRAFYYACMVFLLAADDPAPIIAEGIWHGEITHTPQGVGGFGYDPYFYLADIDKTAAQLSVEQKNGVSHRGQSLRSIVSQMQNRRLI